MTTSKADRPYGSFPRDGTADEPAPEPPPKRRRSLWRRIEVPFYVLVAMAAIALIVGTRPGPRIAELNVPLPTPTPTITELYAQVAPSVVQIKVRTDANAGSGIVLDDVGDILTALHVVAGQTDITVTFADGTTVAARILASLPDSDIAALRVLTLPAQLVPATLGNPDSVQIGDDAIVIGSPFGLNGSLTTGVISGLGRSVQTPGQQTTLRNLIQFDAAVNPGSSGGPLFNRAGDVVGIVTALANPTGQRSFSGVGFAVRIDTASSAAGLPPD